MLLSLLLLALFNFASIIIDDYGIDNYSSFWFYHHTRYENDEHALMEITFYLLQLHEQREQTI